MLSSGHFSSLIRVCVSDDIQALSLEPTNLFSTHMLKIVLEEDMLSTDIEGMKA